MNDGLIYWCIYASLSINELISLPDSATHLVCDRTVQVNCHRSIILDGHLHVSTKPAIWNEWRNGQRWVSNKTTHFWWWFTKCEYMCPIYWIYMSRVFIWGKRSQNSKKNQLSKNQGPVSIKKVFPYIEGRSSLYNGNSYIVISRLGLSPAAFELRLMGWESPNISRSHARYGVYFENFVENSFDSLWFRNATHWDIELSQHWLR